MEVPNFLPLHGQDSIRSSRVSGFRLPIAMENGTQKHKAGIASPVLAKDHLQAGEEGGSSVNLYLVVLSRLRDLLLIAQPHATC